MAAAPPDRRVAPARPASATRTCAPASRSGRASNAMRAAGVEAAARRPVARARHHALDLLEPRSARLGLGNRAQEALRVGVARCAQQLDARALLDDLAGVHDRDAVGHLVDHAEVVRDEQHRRAGLGAEVAQQLQDLRADGGIERGGRLVGDQQARAHGHGHGDHDALLEPAGELVRIGVEAARAGSGMPTMREQLHDARARRLARHAPCSSIASMHLLADRRHRVQARHRLLEDHADPGAAHRAHLRHRQRQQIAALEEDAAAGSMRPGLGTSRMMASAVIDLPQPDSPTSASVSPAAMEKLDPIDHAHARRALAGKGDAQALDRQQGRAHRSSLRVRGSMMSRMASAIMLTASTSVNSATEAPARFHQMIGRARELVARLVDHLAPAAVEADAEIGQDRLRQHQRRERQREGDDDEVGDVGQDVAPDDAAFARRRARAPRRTKSASRSLRVSPRAMRQKCTQPVTPSATHTCTVPLPSTMMSAISSSRLGTEASTVMTKNTRVVDAAGRNSRPTRRTAARWGSPRRLVSPPISSATRAPLACDRPRRGPRRSVPSRCVPGWGSGWPP